MAVMEADLALKTFLYIGTLNNRARVPFRFFDRIAGRLLCALREPRFFIEYRDGLF